MLGATMHKIDRLRRFMVFLALSSEQTSVNKRGPAMLHVDSKLPRDGSEGARRSRRDGDGSGRGGGLLRRAGTREKPSRDADGPKTRDDGDVRCDIHRFDMILARRVAVRRALILELGVVLVAPEGQKASDPDSRQANAPEDVRPRGAGHGPLARPRGCGLVG